MIPRDTGELHEPSEAERDELLAYATSQLEWASGLDSFLATATLPAPLGTHGGTYGDLTEARSIGETRQHVGLYRPCEEETSTARTWHEFCREHGYPRVEDPEGYPPFPAHGGGIWVGLTWAEVRTELRGEAERQLDLLEVIG